MERLKFPIFPGTHYKGRLPEPALASNLSLEPALKIDFNSFFLWYEFVEIWLECLIRSQRQTVTYIFFSVGSVHKYILIRSCQPNVLTHYCSHKSLVQLIVDFISLLTFTEITTAILITPSKPTWHIIYQSNTPWTTPNPLRFHCLSSNITCSLLSVVTYCRTILVLS